jgi:hypothetical protein
MELSFDFEGLFQENQKVNQVRGKYFYRISYPWRVLKFHEKQRKKIAKQYKKEI